MRRSLLALRSKGKGTCVTARAKWLGGRGPYFTREVRERRGRGRNGGRGAIEEKAVRGGGALAGRADGARAGETVMIVRVIPSTQQQGGGGRDRERERAGMEKRRDQGEGEEGAGEKARVRASRGRGRVRQAESEQGEETAT